MRLATLCCAVICAISAAAADDIVPLSLNPKSCNNITASADAATGEIDITTTAGPSQYIFSMPLERELAEGMRYLSFEYKSSDVSTLFQIWYGNEWSDKRARTHGSLTATDKWMPMTIDIASDRKDFKWGNKGDMLWFCSYYKTAGVSVKFRNIRFSSSRPNDESLAIKKLTIPAYVNPAGNHMPVLGWGAKFSRKQYEDMKNGGFNLNYCNFSTNKEISDQIANARGTGVRIIADYWKINRADMKKELRQETVRTFAGDSTLAGWALKDEPRAYEYSVLGKQADEIREVLPKSQTVYLNLLHGGTKFSDVGALDFDDYLSRSMFEVRTSFISFDCYPIVRAADGKLDIRPFYFETLETARNVALKFNVPFWAFVRCRADKVNTTDFPLPELSHIKYQVFTSLAYGAQGIQYFTYANRDYTKPQNLSPLEVDSATWDWAHTRTWDMVAQANRELHNLEWVFLGCKVATVGHTGTTLPKGTKRLAALPAKFKSVTTSTNGALVSCLTNGSNAFMMIMGRDMNEPCTVTVKKKKAKGLSIVGADGTKKAVGKNDDVFTIMPGDYVIYQWSGKLDMKPFKASK